MNLIRIEPIEETKEEICLKCGLKVGEQGQYAYASELDLVIVCEPCARSEMVRNRMRCVMIDQVLDQNGGQ